MLERAALGPSQLRLKSSSPAFSCGLWSRVIIKAWLFLAQGGAEAGMSLLSSQQLPAASAQLPCTPCPGIFQLLQANMMAAS